VWRDRLLNLLTLLISIALCLAALEVVLDFIDRRSEDRTDKRFHPERGWAYTPGTYTEKPAQSWLSHEIQINSLGLRGPEPVFPANGRFHVVVVGDSFTFGRAVPEEALYTSRLAELLAERHATNATVLNAGVEGYGTAQQLLLIRELARHEVTADLYVLQVFTNDILDNLALDYSSLEPRPLAPRYRLSDSGQLVLEAAPSAESWRPEYADPGPRFRSLAVAKTAVESFAQWNPTIVNFARRLGISTAFPRLPGLVNAWYTDAVLREGIPLITALLSAIDAEIAALNAELLVLIVPSPIAVYSETYGPMLRATFPDDRRINEMLSDLDRPQRTMRKICDELGIRTVDASAVLSSPDGSTYIPREGHLSPLGHELVAELLYGAIAQKFVQYRGSPSGD
jgi:lysophospholipase L1-like esterase